MRSPIPQGLYLITDDEQPATLERRVESALAGGVRILQFRSKNLPEADRFDLGRRLRRLCRAANILFIVNDNVELARSLDADGVHLGQDDGEIAQARRLLGEGRIIGRSTRTARQVEEAHREGADYIGFGSVFPTGTKQDATLVGLEALEKTCRDSRMPVVAIGGIHRDNAGLAIDAGAHNVAVVSAVMKDASPALAAKELALLFHRRNPAPKGRVLVAAGSDSGGGAGIQADIRTLSLLGAYGMTAVTALTSQNSLGVQAVFEVPAETLASQMRSVLSDLGADLIKTGMLCSAEAVSLVAQALRESGALGVLDPVLRSSSGTALLSEEGLELFKTVLLPRAYLLTPNLPEASLLTGMEVRDRSGMEEAARALFAMGARNILLKGGHLEGEALDILYDGRKFLHFSAPRVQSPHTHGTGCTLASAICALLATGTALPEAVRQAKRFVTAAIASAFAMGRGPGPVNQIAAALQGPCEPTHLHR